MSKHRQRAEDMCRKIYRGESVDPLNSSMLNDVWRIERAFVEVAQEARNEALEDVALVAWNHEPQEYGPIETAIRTLKNEVKS